MPDVIIHACVQVVICGPSGVGKSTLVAKLLVDLPGRLGFAVSCTTRAARPGEVPADRLLAMAVM